MKNLNKSISIIFERFIDDSWCNWKVNMYTFNLGIFLYPWKVFNPLESFLPPFSNVKISQIMLTFLMSHTSYFIFSTYRIQEQLWICVTSWFLCECSLNVELFHILYYTPGVLILHGKQPPCVKSGPNYCCQNDQKNQNHSFFTFPQNLMPPMVNRCWLNVD